MELEEILKKYIEAKKLLEGSELLVATGLVYIDGSKELKMADALLAETTKADAEMLAQATERATSRMTWLTIAMLLVGLIQIVIASLPFLRF